MIFKELYEKELETKNVHVPLFDAVLNGITELQVTKEEMAVILSFCATNTFYKNFIMEADGKTKIIHTVLGIKLIIT